MRKKRVRRPSPEVQFETAVALLLVFHQKRRRDPVVAEYMRSAQEGVRPPVPVRQVAVREEHPYKHPTYPVEPGKVLRVP